MIYRIRIEKEETKNGFDEYGGNMKSPHFSPLFQVEVGPDEAMSLMRDMFYMKERKYKEEIEKRIKKEMSEN